LDCHPHRLFLAHAGFCRSTVRQDGPDALAATQHRQIALIGEDDGLGTAVRTDHHRIGIGAMRTKVSKKRGQLSPRLARRKNLIDTRAHDAIIAEGCTPMDTHTRSGSTSGAPTAELIASDGATADRFGSSVATSESTIDVGPPYRTPVGGQSQQGATYVFGAPGSPGGTTTSTSTTTPTYNPPHPTPLPVRSVAAELEKDVLEVFSGLGFAGLLKTGSFGVLLDLTYPAYPGDYQLSGSASPNAIPGFAARASTAGTSPAAQACTKHVAEPVVLFRFQHTYTTAGKYMAKIHLTTAGRKLLRAAKRAHRSSRCRSRFH
jgi:hypothetical protein